MDYVIWSKMYSMNVPYIDNQHKKLFVHMNELYSVLKDNNAEGSIFQKLNDFIHYSELHFKDEEDILELIEYPQAKLRRHKRIHDNIIEQEYKLNDQLLKGDESGLYNLECFLNSWVIRHILVNDKEFQPYLAKYRLYKPKELQESTFFAHI
ncbi:MAG: hemerythrin family protein [Calditrichaceae bacterium]|nr:hemerythrin family protein [Calditrichaceae bacterium]